MIRCPLVLERLNWDAERAEVTYQARPKRSKGPSAGIARWDVLEFIARITDHIPEPGQQLVRNWSYYANASRAKRRRESGIENSTEDTQHGQDSSDAHRQRRLSWAKMIQKVYEIDPLLCSFCGGEVKILSLSSPSLIPSRKSSTQWTCPRKSQSRSLIHLPFSETPPTCLSEPLA